MHQQYILRFLRFYYWAIAAYCLLGAVLTPISQLFTTQNIALIPIYIIPALIVCCFLGLIGYEVRDVSQRSYKIALSTQMILTFASLFVFVVSWEVGLIIITINGCLLLLLFRAFQESVKPALPAQTLPRRGQRTSHLVRTTLIATMSVCVAVIIGWCVVSEYTAQTMSANMAMRRLAGVQDTRADAATIRQALLTSVPVGTTDTDVMAFLEARQVPRDQFVGGQFVRYQVNHSDILALFSTPPWVITVFCSQAHYGIRFTFDSQGELTDIIMEDYVYCL